MNEIILMFYILGVITGVLIGFLIGAIEMSIINKED